MSVTDWNIDDWLGGLGLDQYVEVFVDNGYDIPSLVASLSEKDLDVMHVNDREHREQLLKEAANVPADKPPPKPKRTRPASVLRKMSAPDIEGSAEGLTRLQLKLKVGSELKNDKVEITALPYITEDGHPDTVSLFNLSKKYAGQFEVKVDDVYNTILDIWRIRREAEAGKTKSVFSQDHLATSPISSPPLHGPMETYDEIFDLASDKKPVRVRRKTSGDISTGITMATSPTLSAMVSDVQPPKSAPSFNEEEESPQASEVPELSKQPASDGPVRQTNAIRTVSNGSSSDSQKTASGGQSTDSDSSSPDGSPAITRKKRIWERTGKAKETYTALRGTGKSAEDITTRKEKKKKHHFLWRMKIKFFSKTSTRLTVSPESDKPCSDPEDTEGHLVRAASLPALALETTGGVFENYSQPFDSIAPVSCSPPVGPPLPVRYTAKQRATLPSGFSPLQLRKSPTLDNSLLEPVQLNGNLNCCLDQSHPSSLPDSAHPSDNVRLEAVVENMPEIPPRNYTPPSDDDEAVVPPRQDDYFVTEDSSKMAASRSSAHDIELPPRTKQKGSPPVPVQQKAKSQDMPVSRSLPPLSSNDIPPPKPARKQQASADFSSPQRHTWTGAAQEASPVSVVTTGDVLRQPATQRRRPPPKPPVITSSSSESPISVQAQIVHSSPTSSQGERSGHHGSGSPSPSSSPAQPESSTAESTSPPKPPRAVPLSASTDGIASSIRVCYKGGSPVGPFSRGSAVAHQKDYSPSLPLKPRLRGMTQPSTSSKAALPLTQDIPSLQTSNKPPLPPKPAPPRPPKSPHVRSLSPWLPRPHSAGASVSQDFLPPNGSVSPTAPCSSQTSRSVQASGMCSGTPPPRAIDRTPPMNEWKGLVTRPSIPPKPTLRWQSPPDEQRSALIRTVEAKLREENISLAEEPYSRADGGCGIPPLLVSRYAREMRESRETIGEALDFVRLHQLQRLGRMAVAASLMYWQSGQSESVDTTSVRSWLTSIGLPMYMDSFAEAGFTQVDHLPWLTDSHYKQLELNDPLHKEYIVEGLKRL